ncbi:MAG TPA: hypothetical protein VGW78_03895 [Candidatus Babeliales bacterium]|jgi:hypothetical protein|nr:hypothetical protein [Candidatus Babeliales bacterium]
MKKIIYISLFTALFGIVGLGIYGNEFVKKNPARIARKHAQQRDKLIEKCATLLDVLMSEGTTVLQQCTHCIQDWYGLLKSLATTESCCIETAPLDALKEYVASLQEANDLQQKLTVALQKVQEKRLLLNQIDT